MVENSQGLRPKGVLDLGSMGTESAREVTVFWEAGKSKQKQAKANKKPTKASQSIASLPGLILEPLGAHFGTVLGTILEAFWDPFWSLLGPILGPCSGLFSHLFWDPFFVPFWRPSWDPLRPHFGPLGVNFGVRVRASFRKPFSGRLGAHLGPI